MNVYEMYAHRGHEVGFWITGSRWKDRQARVVSIGNQTERRLRGQPPFFGFPEVRVEMHDVQRGVRCGVGVLQHPDRPHLYRLLPDPAKKLFRVITLKHPWAWAILKLGKTVENRSWLPAPELLGQGEWLLIHGGRSPVNARGVASAEFWREVAALELVLRRLPHEQRQKLREVLPVDLCSLMELPAGEMVMEGVVGAVRFQGVSPDPLNPWSVRGEQHWQLGERVVFPQALPMTGQPLLWTLEACFNAEVRSFLPTS